MLKVIWNKDEFDQVKKLLEDNYQVKLTTDPNDVPEGKIGILIDDKNIDQVKEILDLYVNQKQRIILETQNGYMQVHTNEILYIESFGEEIFMHFDKTNTEMIKKPLYQLEVLLKPYHFVRIGKSYIVNILKIRFIRTLINAKLDLELVNGIHLEVSRSFVKDFKNAIGI